MTHALWAGEATRTGLIVMSFLFFVAFPLAWPKDDDRPYLPLCRVPCRAVNLIDQAQGLSHRLCLDTSVRQTDGRMRIPPLARTKQKQRMPWPASPLKRCRNLSRHGIDKRQGPTKGPGEGGGEGRATRLESHPFCFLCRHPVVVWLVGW
jgi:hypothetical protein